MPISKKTSNESTEELSPPKTPLYEKVIRDIYHYIDENHLLPGDSLPSETELAAQLGVSRNTLREATRVLQSIGIIKSTQRTGMVIKNFSFYNLTRFYPRKGRIFDVSQQSVFTARLWFEKSIIPFILEQITAEDIDMLSNMLKPMIASCIDENADAFWQADLDFHRAYYRCMRNDVMMNLGDILLSYVQIIWGDALAASPHTTTSMIVTLEEHKKLIGFLKEKDSGKLLKLISAVHGMPK